MHCSASCRQLLLAQAAFAGTEGLQCRHAHCCCWRQHSRSAAAASRLLRLCIASVCRYRPLLTPGFQRCRAQLPWWQIYGPAGEPIQAITAPLPPQQEPEMATA